MQKTALHAQRTQAAVFCDGELHFGRVVMLTVHLVAIDL